MPEINRPLLRIAMEIQEHLHIATPAESRAVEMPGSLVLQCDELVHNLKRATQEGFFNAAHRLRRDLLSATGQLRDKLVEMDRQIADTQQGHSGTSVHEIYADLIALHQEFEDVGFDRRKRTLSVTTESIELESIFLGPFEICLDWSRPPQGGYFDYKVIAQDPHPASSDSNVTHPHVQHEAVCEGHGEAAIRSALRQGRLLDFFTMIANLLRTYNATSPYVSLSEWNGVECEDCGRQTCEEERWNCDQCEASLCGECNQQCASCSTSQCNECVSSCSDCDDPHCESCLRACCSCSDNYCENCLEDKKCENCRDEVEDNKATSEVEHCPASTSV